MASNIRPGEEGELFALVQKRAQRREFLKWSGAAAAILVGAGCDNEDTQTIVDVTPTPPTPPAPDPQNPSGAAAVTINAANDFGILNFAFALEQLEAAFYTQVVATPYAGITDQERRILTDLRDHEIIHREFFRAAITALAPAGTVLPNLTPNFASINFNSRVSVLTTAQTFEDLGVAAYNGGARFIQSADIVAIAGKIVSVEARHAAAISDLIRPRSNAFAPDAFDQALRPSQVLAAADPYIQNPITVTNAPAGF
jgi:rubrerythrin